MHSILYFRARNVSILDAILVARLGTVESLQVQDAAVVLYSIANQAEWLLSPNRWNVATSRAMECEIVVGDMEAHLTPCPARSMGLRLRRNFNKYWKIIHQIK